MGMYTEVFISCALNKDLPDEVREVLAYLFAKGDAPEWLPNHEFFRTERWIAIGRRSSYYFVPRAFSMCWYDDIAECHYLTSRSDLKNYDNEIELFFNWIMPYVDEPPGQFIGYHRYEGQDLPTLVTKTES